MTDSRSVLVVAYDFPPHGAIGTMRTLRLVRHLDRLGWRVNVLTGDAATFLPGTPVDHALSARVPAATRALRVPAWRHRRTTVADAGASPPGSAGKSRAHRWPSAIVRTKRFIDALAAIPDRESAWLIPAVRSGLRAFRANPPDIIYSSAPPWTGQVVAGVLAAKLRRPWVADFRDPWARLPWRENRPWLQKRVAGWLEDQTVKRAAAVIFTTGRIAADVAAHHDTRFIGKYHVVPNGCDVTEFPASVAPAARERFVLLHAGSLYGGRDPRPLMQAISTGIERGLIDRERFTLRLIGSVVLDGVDLMEEAKRLRLQDVVQLEPRLLRQQCLNEMASASALLLVQSGHPLSIPAKAYEYLATGRPILALADDGETADLVTRSGAGLVVSAEDMEGLVSALVTLTRHPERFRPAAPTLFDGELRASETVTIFEKVLGSPAAAHSPLATAFADA